MDIDDEESELDAFKPDKEEKKSKSPTKKASAKKESAKKDTPSKKRGKDGKPKEEAKGKGKPKKDDGKTKMGGEANVKAPIAKLVFMDIPMTKEKVEEYMLRHNRPYSVQDILNNY